MKLKNLKEQFLNRGQVFQALQPSMKDSEKKPETEAIERVRSVLIAIRKVPNEPLGTGFIVERAKQGNDQEDVVLNLDDVLWLLLAYDEARGSGFDGRLLGSHLVQRNAMKERFEK